VRRAAHVGHVLHSVGRGIDERHGVGADRDDHERSMVRREAKAVHKKLTAVEWAHISWCHIAQTNDTEQRVVCGICDGDGVRKLFRRIHAVPMTNRKAGAGSGHLICGVVRRRWTRRGAGNRFRLRARRQRETHHRDLLLLGDDDLLREPAQLLVAPGFEFCLRHRDGAHVMRNHHGGKVGVHVARRRHVHGRHHLPHRLVNLGDKLRLLAVRLCRQRQRRCSSHNRHHHTTSSRRTPLPHDCVSFSVSFTARQHREWPGRTPRALPAAGCVRSRR